MISVRTQARIGNAVYPVINPNNLKIEGWYVDDRFSKQTLILLSKDVRDFIPNGIVIDDHESLSPPEDLLRLKEVLELNYNPIGKVVVTNHHRRLGKVSDFACDLDSYFVHKLYVERPLLRSLRDSQLVIDRNQIIEITPQRILVSDADEKVGVTAAATA